MTLRWIALSALIVASSPLSAQEPTFDVPHDDLAMHAAFARVAATLDDFLALWRQPPPGAKGFSVKVGLVIDESPPFYRAITPGAAHKGYAEYFWIAHLSETASGFEGDVDNESEHILTVRRGQRIAFTKTQIADWMYVSDARIMGFATFCPSIAHEDDETRAALSARLGLNCD